MESEVYIPGSFDVEEEFKPEPLVPQGTYHGHVTAVSYDPDQNAVVWQVTLADNSGVKSDGETPIDGSILYFRNFLPREGDENELTRDGRMTKRQAKINMLHRFCDAMGIDMSTPAKIAEAIRNAEWVGLQVDVQVGIREYEGTVSNEIRRMTAVGEGK